MSGDVATRDEIRAAVAYGQMLAVRSLLDDLAKASKADRREHAGYMHGEEWVRLCHRFLDLRQQLDVWNKAELIVKAYKVSEEDQP